MTVHPWGGAARAAVLAIAVAPLVATLAPARGLSGAQERTFRPLRPLGAATHLTASVHLGDVDGDGALDIVVANGRHWPEQNRIFLNDGRGGFTLARRLGDEEDGTYAAPLADFDGDGDLDIATGNDRTRNLIFFNDGAGHFERGPTFGAPSSTRSLTLADLDGDGHTDILVVNRGRRNFIFRGDGTGAFDGGTPFGAGDDSTIDVAAADLDRDGDLDLVLANRDGGANAIHWNDEGAFDRQTPYGTGTDETRGVAVGDVNGDGLPDIVVANIGEANAAYLGAGGGSFVRGHLFGHEGDQSFAVRLADLDLDGDLDIVVANAGAQNAVYFNRGGELEEFRFGCGDCATYGIAVGDLNGDGFPDIITANSGAPNGVFANVPAGTGGPRGASAGGPQSAVAPTSGPGRAGVSPESGLRPGILVMAHGGGAEWNGRVEDALRPLRDRVPVSLALGMADPRTMQSALNSLADEGANTVVVVRLFVSGASFLHPTEFLLGLRPDPPERAMVGHRVVSGAELEPLAKSGRILLVGEGLGGSGHAARILGDRAATAGVRADESGVLLLAHGMGDEGEDRQVLRSMEDAARALRAGGYAEVHVGTLREDWAGAREAAEERIRARVAGMGRRHRNVLVIPYRLSGLAPTPTCWKGSNTSPRKASCPIP
ncbi:FG-GAP-like repeat-containing protein [Candidatus Palauibacter sp.]|uniref:FG-GAP-like repeat-containing protein n=1 Tax=Candidatus Palauibacter sp. TaxID=3101350 RepID=UPI003B527E51